MAATRSLSATSRDPEEWAKATQAAREQRERSAAEVAGVIASQVAELMVTADIMGGRALVAQRIEHVLIAEKRRDQVALRAAAMDLSVAGGLWVASIDFRPPQVNGNGNGRPYEEPI